MAIVSRQGSYSPFGSMHDKTQSIRRAIEGIFYVLSKWKFTKNAGERERENERVRESEKASHSSQR